MLQSVELLLQLVISSQTHSHLLRKHEMGNEIQCWTLLYCCLVQNSNPLAQGPLYFCQTNSFSLFFLLVAYFVLNLFSLFKCRHSCCRCHVTIHKVAKIPRVSDFHGLCLGLLKCNKITIKTKKS